MSPILTNKVSSYAKIILTTLSIIDRNTSVCSFRMDFNLAGHVLEASSTTWNSSIGSIHNNGHVVFGTNQIQVI